MAVLAALSAAAEPFVPVDDSRVLERFPRAVTGERAQLRTLKARLDADPGNLALAVELADRWIALARAEADPRFWGYAEGVMQPWLSAERPPPVARVLRATLAQMRHDFEAAETDLLAALDREPGNARAWLTLATIYRVQGRYTDAGRACDRLFRAAPPAIGLTCRADITALTGGATETARRLRVLLTADGEVPEEVRSWTLGVLAEAAARAGDSAAAEAAFREALALGRRDVWLLAAWADFLLDQGRPQEVRRLLRDDARADPLLLRLAVAERMLDDPAWVGRHDTLRRRIDAGRARGDASHLREEARVALALADDPQAGLRLALDNWRVQREPADARVVLQATLAAGRPAEARGALNFLAATGLEDPLLADLARRLVEAGA
jgi:tetratricopeptide (TPR) repeat protein